MADSLWMRLREVPWDKFACNPGTKKKIPKILENLASRKEPRAMKASHELWAALCAGKIAPAAEPTVPFLGEILGICAVGVQSEILDILITLSQVPTSDDAPAWHHQVIEAIQQELPIIIKRSRSRNDIVSDKAKRLIDHLSN